MTDPIKPNLFQRAALGLVPHTNQTKLSIVQRFLAAVPLAIIGISAMLTEAVLGLKGYAFNAVSIMVGSDQRANKIDRVAGTIFGYIGKTKNLIINSTTEPLLSDKYDRMNQKIRDKFTKLFHTDPKGVIFSEEEIKKIFPSITELNGSFSLESSKTIKIEIDGKVYNMNKEAYNDLTRFPITLNRNNGEKISIFEPTFTLTRGQSSDNIDTKALTQSILNDLVKNLTLDLDPDVDNHALILNTLNCITAPVFANAVEIVNLSRNSEDTLSYREKNATRSFEIFSNRDSITFKAKLSFNAVDSEDLDNVDDPLELPIYATIDVYTSFVLKDKISNAEYSFDVQ